MNRLRLNPPEHPDFLHYNTSMPAHPKSTHALLILQDRRVVFANRRAAEILGVQPKQMLRFSLERLLLSFSPSDANRISRLVGRVEGGEISDPEAGLCLQGGQGGCTWIDLLVTRTIFREQAALQMTWIDNSPRLSAEEQLQQNIWRLQILHDIDHAMLAVQDENETAAVALRHISYLVPDYHSSSAYRLDRRARQAELLACDGQAAEILASDEIPTWTELTGNGQALQEGLPDVIPDLTQIEKPNQLQRALLENGVRACLHVPLRWDGELQGALNLYSSAPTAFSAERVQIAQEIANLLAVALQQAHLKQLESQRRQEAEMMRDMMASLASATDLNQTLEAILLNLHNVIDYDRASLYLVDENQRFVVAKKEVQEQQISGRAFHENNPLVDQMRLTRKPIIVADIQSDARFHDWPEVETVHGWLGAPLFVGEEMLGFISLGSLQANSFSPEQAERLQVFADQAALVMERLWQTEQTERRREELEVLSSITLALGQVESGENSLSAVLNQITHFSGAQGGAFLFPDRLETALVVKASLDEEALGRRFPARWDPFWSVYVRGETHVIDDLAALPDDEPSHDCQRLFGEASSAVLAPVKLGGNTFGVLVFGFDSQHSPASDNLHMCVAVAEIAAASLRRSVVLESLEKQVDVRTQHLSTLYEINAIASDSLELPVVLERVLGITLESLTGQVGLIHFRQEKEAAFRLAVQIGLQGPALASLQSLSANGGFWERLAQSSNPVLINDTASEPNLPAEFTELRRLAPHPGDYSAFIGAPIRAKGQALGLLSLFDRSILDYTIEEITLFMTIADQIGGLVERARLMRQAEIAAVVQERQRLARELHDSVTQLLYSQVLFAGAGLKVLSQGDLAMAQGHLNSLDQGAQQALKEMRLLVYQLRPSDYLDEGLVGALTRRLDSVEKRTGINARLVVEGSLRLDELLEMALYRIAEEALNNTLKHAQASAVTITLRALEGRVILEIADNGIGFNPQQPAHQGGMGLDNMRERAEDLGGQIEFDSQPGKGAQIRIEIEVAQ